MNQADVKLVASIREKYARALDDIEKAAGRAGRSPESVRLVVVTKSQPLEVVRAAVEAGVRILGENYAEEAVSKMEALRSAAEPDAEGSSAGAWPKEKAGVEWHMIGHIQSRKAKLVAQYFDLVHSLDSVKLAERLDRAAAEIGRKIPILLEFNVGGEAEKHGWPAVDEAAWADLLDDVKRAVALPNLRIEGLMTMPPLSSQPEQARVYFRRLRKLRDFLGASAPGVDWKELSMGTSADFTVAVEEGATLVRVGEAIVGPRTAREAQ